MVAWFQSSVRSCWIGWKLSGTGAAFIQVLWLSLPVLIPSIAPYELIILSLMLHTAFVHKVMRLSLQKKTPLDHEECHLLGCYTM
jgi:hypothetical protein